VATCPDEKLNCFPPDAPPTLTGIGPNTTLPALAAELATEKFDTPD